VIELTKEQRRELNKPEPKAFDPETQETYVLVRQEVYARLRELLEADTVLATGDLLDRVMAEDDANDPSLDSYQSITREGQR
jgi:hypothetical protein